MTDYTHEELTEALGTIDSFLQACETEQAKFPQEHSRHALLRGRMKALCLSKALIVQALAKNRKKPAAARDEDGAQLFAQLDRLHTTQLGAERIRKNLALRVSDVALWCKETVQRPDCRITRAGKNWYILADGCEITVNAHSYTIITAHKVTKTTSGVSK